MSEQVTSYRPAAPTSSLAVVSLVFGILSWIVLPFIGAVVAIICGHMARSEIRNAAPDRRPEGDGMAVAGLVLGYAQIALCILAIFLLIVFLAFGVAFFHWG
jgi:phosphate/sulfate permease